MARPDKRKGKRVWVVMDGPRHPIDPFTGTWGVLDIYRTKGAALWRRDCLADTGWVGLTIRPATLVLDEPKRRGK